MSKFLTMATYNSGRKEIFSDKNADAMKQRRTALSRMPTITDIRTPTLEELTEVK